MESNALQSGTLLQGKSYTYTIQKALGQGSFGITYLAMTQVKVTGALGELETTMQVAIKEFFMKEINGREDNTVTSGSKGGIYDKYKQNFAREAKNLSKLHHPHIIKVLEYFETNNTVYYAMEYVEGGSLDEYIAQKSGLPEAECVKYTKQIGAALSYMHTHKMLHLDLKPGNVMLRKNGDAVLIDFGLSKQYDENGEPESSITVGGGTPGYAPLEQSDYQEGKEFPVTMDVYALGATMFKMLVGNRPPKASDILNNGFPAYELQKLHVSNALISCIAYAMAPMKKDRPQSVEIFLTNLEGEETSLTIDEDKNVTKPDKETTHPAQPDFNATPNQGSSKNKKYILSGIAAILIIAGTIVYGISQPNANTEQANNNILTEDSVAIINPPAAVNQSQVPPKDTLNENSEGIINPVKSSVKNATVSSIAENKKIKVIEKKLTPQQMYNKGREHYKNRNYEEAVKWYRKAAEQGYALAQYYLGSCYEEGQGVAQDDVEAVKWYRMAAEQGHVDSQSSLGSSYIIKDYQEAFKWYRMAAEQRHADSQFMIGFMYENGWGVTENYKEATKWYPKAAEQGYVFAQYSLACMYDYGKGVAENKQEAIIWYRKAAEQKHSKAKERLQELGVK